MQEKCSNWVQKDGGLTFELTPHCFCELNAMTLRCGVFFGELKSVDLFNQVVLDSHLLDLVELGLDKIYMSLLFLED